MLRMLRGESLDALNRQTAAPVPRLEEWVRRCKFLRPRILAELRLDAANRRFGELSMELELLRRADRDVCRRCRGQQR